jgi:O-antigen polymerase
MLALRFDSRFQSARIIIAALFLLTAWLFPLAANPAPDTLQQIYAVLAISSAGLVLGLGAQVHRGVTVSIGLAILWMLFHDNVYTAYKASTIAWLILGWVSCKIGATLRGNQRALHWVLGAIFLAAIVNALEGLLQYFGLADALSPWVPDAAVRGKAIGALRQRNLLATFLCCGVICIAWLVQLKKISQSLAWLSLLVLGLGIAASGSRVGVLELLGLAVFAVMLRANLHKAIPRLFLGAVVLVGAATWLLPLLGMLHGFEAEFLGKRFTRDTVRLDLWSNVLDMISIHPWIGWGWNELRYAHYVTLFDQDKVDMGGLLGNAHNLILHMAVTLGIPIASLVTGLACWAGYKTVKRAAAFNEDSHTEKYPSEYFALAILFVIGLHSMLEFPLWHAGFMSLAGMAIGFLALQRVPVEPKKSYRKIEDFFNYGGAAGLIVLCFAAWLQYSTVLKIMQVPFGMKEMQKSAIANAKGAWLFQDHVELMELGSSTVNASNAKESRDRAEKLLHFAPEPLVIESLLSSLIFLADYKELQFHAVRYCKAYPAAYGRWRAEGVHSLSLPQKNDLIPICL